MQGSVIAETTGEIAFIWNERQQWRSDGFGAEVGADTRRAPCKHYIYNQ